MRRMLSAELAELVTLQPIRIVLLVLHGRVIALFTERTGHVDNFTHLFLLDTSSQAPTLANTATSTPASLSPARFVTPEFP